MALDRSALLRLVAIFVVAPIGAAVLLTLVLLLGAKPALVFLPGHALRAALASLGFHVHNRVGVLATFVIWWAIFVFVWWVVRKIRG